MLLVGLWLSSEKPTMGCFLTPLMEEMNDLYSNGMFQYVISTFLHINATITGSSIFYLNNACMFCM